jgi:hypothetical protein
VTSEFDESDSPDVEVGIVDRYRVNVGIVNDSTGVVWSPGDILQVGDIPSSVLNLYVEREYLEKING